MSGDPALGIAGALGSGLPVLLLQFVVCIVLLVVGVAVYTLVTPFHERELLREGNVAAATVLSGAVIALAIPFAALLATSTHGARHRRVGDRGNSAATGDGRDRQPRDASYAPVD